jgi:hypothetical protein
MLPTGCLCPLACQATRRHKTTRADSCFRSGLQDLDKAARRLRLHPANKRSKIRLARFQLRTAPARPAMPESKQPPTKAAPNIWRRENPTSRLSRQRQCMSLEAPRPAERCQRGDHGAPSALPGAVETLNRAMSFQRFGACRAFSTIICNYILRII